MADASLEIFSPLQKLQSLGESTCRDALGWDAPADVLSRCLPEGLACNRLEDEKRRTLHLHSAFLGADRPEAVCVRDRMPLGITK
jgi:hypothetical protein